MFLDAKVSNELGLASTFTWRLATSSRRFGSVENSLHGLMIAEEWDAEPSRFVENCLYRRCGRSYHSPLQGL